MLWMRTIERTQNFLFLQFNCRYRHRIEFEIYKLLVVIEQLERVLTTFLRPKKSYIHTSSCA